MLKHSPAVVFSHLELCGHLLQVTRYFGRQVAVEQLRVLLTNTLVDVTRKKNPQKIVYTILRVYLVKSKI